MNSVLSTCVERSIVVGLRSATRRTRGPLLGLVLLVSGCRGCSYHAHSEWHAGSGSSGGEEAAEPNEQGEGEGEGSTRSTHRRSPGGRDNVVRVTGDGNKSQGGGGGGSGDAPERTVVRPTGDVPASSSGGSGQSAGADSAQGGGSSAAAGASGNATSTASEPTPTQPAEPAAAAPAEQAPDSGKTTNKNPSEPHVTTPTHRKPRKVHRDGATNKEGRRE